MFQSQPITIMSLSVDTSSFITLSNIPLSLVFKGDNCHIFSSKENFNVRFFSDTVNAKSFRLLHDNSLALVQPYQVWWPWPCFKVTSVSETLTGNSVFNTLQYNFFDKWQMDQEYVLVTSALTHTFTPVITKNIVTTVKAFKTNILRVYQHSAV